MTRTGTRRAPARRAPVRTALSALALVVGLVAGSGAGARPVAAQGEGAPAVRRVLIVTLPGVSWAEMRAAHLPHLEHLVSGSAVGVMTTQIGRGPASTPAAYLTIGAGTRAVEPGVDTGVALNPDELHGGVLASDILMRRLGQAPEGIAYLPVGAALDRNADSAYGGAPGTLGDLLAEAGVHRAVVANADAAEGFSSDEPPPDGAYSRSAATSLMGTDGIVPGGDVGRGLLREDPEAPFGHRYDHQVVLSTFDAAWSAPGRSVVLVEASDLARASAYGRRSTPAQRAHLREEALRRSDALLGDLVDRVDPETDAVVVLSPVAPSGAGMVVLRSPGVDDGLLRSATTRRDGYVHLADVAPTVLTLLGEDAPTAMEGRSFDVAEARGDRVETLIDQGRAAAARDDRLPGVVQVITAVLVALTLAVALWGRLPGRARPVVRAVAVGALGLVPGTFLAARIPSSVDDGLVYWGVVAGTGLVVGLAGALAERRAPGSGAVVGLASIVGLIAGDVLLGASLQVNTVFGYSTAVAGRFAGLGNLAFALFSAAGLALAVLLVDRYGRRALPWAVALLVAVVLLDGLPMLGADVGGVASMVPAFALAAMVLSGRSIRWQHVVGFGLAAFGAVVAFGLLDASRPPGSRTHLARLGEHVVHGRFSAVADTLVRRLHASFGSTDAAVWALALGVVLLAGLHAVAVEHGLLGPRATRWRDDPPAAALAVGLTVLAGLGLVVNDSSIAVPATMLIVVVPVLLLRRTEGPREAAP